MSNPKMTLAELKYQYQERGNGHFFDRKTMAFFGDTMANYGVRDRGDYWELYRRRPVKHGLQKSAYFDKATFREVWPADASETRREPCSK
jgi:hypothetical protein